MPEQTDPHRWIARYLEGLDDERRREIVRWAAQDALAGVPELAAEQDLQADLSVLATESLRSILAIAALAPGRWDAPDLPPSGTDFARALALRGFDAALLLKVFRVGQAAFWQRIMRVAERDIADPDLRMRVLALMWERLSRWVEHVLEQLMGAHQAERDRWVRGALAHRVETIGRILAGEPLDAARAGLVLGHDLQRHQTAFALWPAGPAEPAQAGLEDAAGDLARALGARRALTMPSGTRGLWGWVATAQAAGQSGLDAALEAHPHLRAAVGRPAPGMDGLRESHREALAAQRIAGAMRCVHAVTRYADVELLCLLTADAPAMRRFVAARLGPLDGEDRAARELQQTALAFLRAQRNASATARVLGVHRNTVRNRLARIDALLGRPLGDDELLLQIALVAAAEVDPHRIARQEIRAPRSG